MESNKQIGYTIVSGQFRLIAEPGERKVDNRAWDLDEEAKAESAARSMAAKRHAQYIGEVR